MIEYNGKSYKVVVVTPAGRKKYMELLIPYILKEKNIIDEYRIWVNTKETSDIKWFLELNLKYKNFINLEFLDCEVNSVHTIHKFFKNCIDKNTIYIRIDDDVVWMENNFFEKLLKARIAMPDFLLLYANIVNNSICDYLQPIKHKYSQVINLGCLDQNGYHNSKLAEEKHNKLIQNIKNNTLDEYRFNSVVNLANIQVSINCISWFGKEFEKFNGNVEQDEEIFLSCRKPILSKKYNAICSDALCSHYAFYVQREYLETTNILEKYRELLNENIL